MALASYVSKGITVTFSTLSALLMDVTFDGESADTVDCTHQASTNEWREFKAGFKDAGGATLALLFDPDATIPDLATSGTLIVNWPTGATNHYAVSAILDNIGAAAPLGDKMTMSLHFRATAASNWAST